MEIYVKSPNGKPVLLLDKDTPDSVNPKEYYRVAINAVDAANGIAKKVLATPFILGMISAGYLVVEEPEKPKVGRKPKGETHEEI
jgi:hypothetical protein